MPRLYPINSRGESVIPALPVGARNVYVADVTQGGDDGNDGLTTATPKASISAGHALIRSGQGDRLWLKRGGQWNSTSITVVSGASVNAPTVYGAWGTGDRPIIDFGSTGGFLTQYGANTREYIALIGIEAIFTGYDGINTATPTFINSWGTDHHILIENCVASDCATAFGFTGYVGGGSLGSGSICLRRNVAFRTHAKTAGGTPQGAAGFYGNNVAGFWLEENVALHCGWKEGVVDRGDFAHGFYLQYDCTMVEAYRNIAILSAAVGMHFRCEGICENNFFHCNRTGLQLGGGGPSPVVGGVVVNGRWNVVQEGEMTGSAVIGIGSYNLKAGSSIRDNLVCNRTAGGTGPAGAIFDGQSQGSVFNGVVVDGNVIHNWGGVVRILGSATQLADSTFTNNQIESSDTANSLLVFTSLAGAQALDHGNNRYRRNGGGTTVVSGTSFSPNPCTIEQALTQIGDATSANAANAYPDPTRTLIRYNDEVLGLGDTSADGLIAEILAMPHDDRDERLGAERINKWMRAGFGMSNPPSATPRRGGSILRASKARFRLDGRMGL